MSDYVLTCSSVADLPPEFTEERNIDVMPYHLYLDGTEYLDKGGKLHVDEPDKPDTDENAITYKDFYQKMRDGASPSTSMVNYQRYMDFFRPYLEQGQDVLHFELSSNLSGAHDNALRAARDLKKEFPDRTVKIIDTLGATGGYGLLVQLADDMKNDGASLEEVAEFADKIRKRILHWFVVEDLEYLRRGGRLSKASAAIGTMLNLKPVLSVNTDGRIVPVEKTRGRKKSIQQLLKHMEEGIDNGGEDQVVVVVHADAPDEAEKLAVQVREAVPKAKDVVIREMGPVIGSHVGPGTVGLGFVGEGRPEGTGE